MILAKCKHLLIWSIKWSQVVNKDHLEVIEAAVTITTKEVVTMEEVVIMDTMIHPDTDPEGL